MQIAQAFQLGQQRWRSRSAVLKMLNEDIPIAAIARITEFTIEQIQKIKAENE
jgi:hypothetical protein